MEGVGDVTPTALQALQAFWMQSFAAAALFLCSFSFLFYSLSPSVDYPVPFSLLA